MKTCKKIFSNLKHTKGLYFNILVQNVSFVTVRKISGNQYNNISIIINTKDEMLTIGTKQNIAIGI